MAANLALLAERFPEYEQLVQAFAAEDPVRRLRWPLDFHRLRRLAASGHWFELLIENWLEGGSAAPRLISAPTVHRGEAVRTLRLRRRKTAR